MSQSQALFHIIELRKLKAVKLAYLIKHDVSLHKVQASLYGEQIKTNLKKKVIQKQEKENCLFLFAYLHWCQKCQGPVHRPRHSLNE